MNATRCAKAIGRIVGLCGSHIVTFLLVVSTSLSVSAQTPTRAIEYYHAVFDHYFVTTIPAEISKLDDGTFVGWSRTGLEFDVYELAGAPASSQAVCRFFSESFAPKSSHFYTNFAAECAGVKKNAAWQFEGEVFNVVAADPNLAGYCPAGTSPVFRFYNGGRGGAPNHRYTASLTAAQQMSAQGWCAEGYGAVLDPRNPSCDPTLPPPASSLGVIFCSPP